MKISEVFLCCVQINRGKIKKIKKNLKKTKIISCMARNIWSTISSLRPSIWAWVYPNPTYEPLLRMTYCSWSKFFEMLNLKNMNAYRKLNLWQRLIQENKHAHPRAQCHVHSLENTFELEKSTKTIAELVSFCFLDLTLGWTGLRIIRNNSWFASWFSGLLACSS